jgi:hypothetical protein
MENRYKIDYDIKQKISTNIKFKQGDIDSSVLEINLYDDGKSIDITGEVIEFRFLKPDKTKVFQDYANGVTILDATKGNVECILKGNTLAVPGTVICEIHRGKEGKQLTTPSFTFIVGKSIGADGIISTNEIATLDTKISEMDMLAHKIYLKSKWENKCVENNLNMILVDMLLDDDSINKTISSSFIFNKNIKTSNSYATVFWYPFSSPIVPTKAYIISDVELHTGNINFYFSRDGGTTYTKIINLELLTDISTQPSGSNIILKVEIIGDAILNMIGYGWQ